MFSVDWQLGALTLVAEMMLVGALARQLEPGLDVAIDATGHDVEARNRHRRGAESLGGVVRAAPHHGLCGAGC